MDRASRDEQVARIYLGEATAQAPAGADVLVLACTHYPLIAPLLRRIVPATMEIVDSAASTAQVVRKMIEENLACHPEWSELAPATEPSRRTCPGLVEGLLFLAPCRPLLPQCHPLHIVPFAST